MLNCNDHGPACVPVERMLTRRERKIERMRTQVMGPAKRSQYRTSGTPVLARPAIYREVIR